MLWYYVKKAVDPLRSARVKANQAKAAQQRLLFAALCKQNGLPEPVTEVKFHPDRKWRFDYAWPQLCIALEVEGGVWTGGAHTRGGHFLSDMEKYNAAGTLGWRVFRTVPSKLLTAATIDLLRSALSLH